MKSILTPFFTLIFGVFIALCSLTSCQQNPHAERIEKADSLKTAVKELDAIFSNIDYDHHMSNRSDMMQDMERVEGHFKSTQDTMPRDLAFELSDYRLIWKGYKRMEGEYKNLKKELDYTGQQVKTLHTDLENNSLSENMAQRFLNEEVEAVEKLDNGVRSFAEKMKRTEKKYKDKKPVIVQLADSLENSKE